MIPSGSSVPCSQDKRPIRRVNDLRSRLKDGGTVHETCIHKFNKKTKEMKSLKEEIFALKDEELFYDLLPVNKTRKVFVITSNEKGRLSTIPIVCFTKEEALIMVYSLMRATNVELEVNLDKEKASWFHTAEKDAFIRMDNDVAKMHSFQYVRECPHLFKIKYEIVERIINKRYV